MPNPRTSRAVPVVSAVAGVLLLAGCSSAPTPTPVPTTPVSSAATSAAPPDPVALASDAHDALSASAGFAVTGVLAFEASTATVDLQVGTRTGHGSMITPFGTVTIDWSGDGGGLFLTAPDTFWTTFGQPGSLAGRVVSVPPTSSLDRLEQYVRLDAFVPRLFQMLAGAPADARALGSPAGPAFELEYDVAGSQLTVLDADPPLPIRVKSASSDLTLGGFGQVPAPDLPAPGGSTTVPS